MGKFKRNREVVDETLERDDYTCQVCQTNENLTVHHIIRLADKGPDDVTNTITLCRKDHDEIERLYNTGHESPLTFYKWLERRWRDYGT